MTLNDLELHNSPYFAHFTELSNYVTVLEDRVTARHSEGPP